MLIAWNGRADPRPIWFCPGQPQPSETECFGEFSEIMDPEDTQLHQGADLAPTDLGLASKEVFFLCPEKLSADPVYVFEETDARADGG